MALLEDVDAATPNDVADASVRQNMNLVIPPEHPLAKINQWDTGVTYRSDKIFLFLFRPVGIIASVMQVYLLVILLSRDFGSIRVK